MSTKKTRATSSNKLRIIGGQWRSRQLGFVSAPGLRPTSNRIRETVFNWLAPHIPGAHCLDVFAGSGALSFEALSRGADSCTALEINSAAATQLRDNKNMLDAKQLSVKEMDANKFLQQNTLKQRFNIVFIDPPFDGQLHSSICAALETSNWLAKNAIIYCELPAADNLFTPPSNWQKLRDKVAGEVRYSLYSVIEPED